MILTLRARLYTQVSARHRHPGRDCRDPRLQGCRR